MLKLWSFLSWFQHNWFIIVWVLGVIITYIRAGKRVAFVVATLGVGVVAFKKGEQSAQAQHNARADRIDSERQNAYEQIDQRDTSRSDVIERLRKSGY